MISTSAMSLQQMMEKMPDLFELYLERVAIMEVEGKIPTNRARFEAYQELRRIYGYSSIPRCVHEMAKNENDHRWKKD